MSVRMGLNPALQKMCIHVDRSSLSPWLARCGKKKIVRVEENLSLGGKPRSMNLRKPLNLAEQDKNLSAGINRTWQFLMYTATRSIALNFTTLRRD